MGGDRSLRKWLSLPDHATSTIQPAGDGEQRRPAQQTDSSRAEAAHRQEQEEASTITIHV